MRSSINNIFSVPIYQSPFGHVEIIREEINKAIEGCRTKQIIGAALETEVNYFPANRVVEDSLQWLKRFGNQEVDLYSDWLIISNFHFLSSAYF